MSKNNFLLGKLLIQHYPIYVTVKTYFDANLSKEVIIKGRRDYRMTPKLSFSRPS